MRSEALRVSSDPREFDLDRIHRWLAASYWAGGIPREVVERSIAGSLGFAVFAGEEQIGFARVISDGATFAYLCDVIVDEAHRGRGAGKALMTAIVAHPKLQGLRRWMLATRDAHGLYARFGFHPVAKPDRFMEIVDPDVYRRAPGRAR